MSTRLGSTLRRLFARGPQNLSGEPERETGVVAEASAVLEGRAADAYVYDGRAIPYWAWLNALAHRPPSALRSVATAYPWGRLTEKTIAIADQLDLVSPDEASAIQAKVLLPAELQALSLGEGFPDAVVRAVQRRVRHQCRNRAVRP